MDHRTRIFLRQEVRMRRIRLASQIAKRTVLLMLALVVIVLIGWVVEFVHRTNNACNAAHSIIQSEADAINRAQVQIYRARYGMHGITGYVDEKPSYTEFNRLDCCTAVMTRTMLGVIVWNVGLRGETVTEPKKRYVSAQMSLSNCGTVFTGESFIQAVPRE